MRNSCVCSENGSEYRTSDGKTWWRCAPLASFFLSYTSTRIHAMNNKNIPQALRKAGMT